MEDQRGKAMKLQDNSQLQTSKLRQRMQLSDGRIFAFDEYGAADGFPVVYMHGTPGSRLEWTMFGMDEMVRARLSFFADAQNLAC
jgi:hypothetical protein